MRNNFEKTASDFLSTAGGQKIAGKKDDLNRLASSKDGEEVKAILQNGGFDDAVKSGDTDAMKKALSDVIKTDAGARLFKQLQDMMGKG